MPKAPEKALFLDSIPLFAFYVLGSMALEGIEALWSVVFEPLEEWFAPEVAGEALWATFEFDTIENLLSFLMNSKLDIADVIILGIAGGGFLLIVKIRNKEPTPN